MDRYDSTTTLDDPAAAGSAIDPLASDDPLAEAGAHVGETAGHLAERAADIGLQQADQGKDRAAHGISQVADSIRRVSLDLESEQPAVAGAAMTAADQAERVARYLQQTDAREILHTVEDAARRQPLLFLGGAFVLGVVASRFFKAAGGTSGAGDGRSQYGYGSQYRSGAIGDFRSGTGYDAQLTARDGAPSEGL